MARSSSSLPPPQNALPRRESARKSAAVKRSLSPREFVELVFYNAHAGKNATELDLTETQQLNSDNLTALFAQMPRLRRLSLRNSQVRQLPAAIGKLENLQELDLSCNNLTSLPRELSDLRALRYLNAARNQLTALPKQIGLMQDLRYLNLSFNELRVLPREIAYLGRLRVLRVALNHLEHLPENIGALGELQVLNVSLNQLRALPQEIIGLHELRVLNLSCNLLTTLPAQLATMPALRALDVSNNAVLIPQAILDCKALRTPDAAMHAEEDEIPPEVSAMHRKRYATVATRRLEATTPSAPRMAVTPATLGPDEDTVKTVGLPAQTRHTRTVVD